MAQNGLLLLNSGHIKARKHPQRGEYERKRGSSSYNALEGQFWSPIYMLIDEGEK